MALAKHIDPERLLESVQHKSTHQPGIKHHPKSALTVPYSTRYNSTEPIPKYTIPRKGVESAAAHQLIKDELDLDGKPNLNLASFVGTYMDREATELIVENIAKNMSDMDEYPAMMAIHERCVSILSHLWGAKVGEEQAVGTATTGSSEAIHLGGLAMKRRWQERRMKEGKPYDKPNILMGANAQVALEKFARYFEVEARILPVSKKSQYRLDPALVKENIDENTIGVFVILGSTYTGHYEPVQEVSDILDAYEKETGISIPIHVDGASGGFIAPFTDAGVGEGLKWNFKLPRVVSINTSGHKFGLVYAGVGWIIWRNKEYLPDHLVFKLHYLGGTEESYTLNFSRPGAQIIGQYYNFINLGYEGFKGVMENCLHNARVLSWALEGTNWFECVSSIHRKVGVFSLEDDEHAKGSGLAREEDESSAAYNAGLPVVAFHLTKDFKSKYPHVRQDTISLLLRAKQYIIPNYPLPPHEEGTEILRVVVRESMSLDLLDRLITDLISIVTNLMNEKEVDLRLYAEGKVDSDQQEKDSAKAMENKPIPEKHNSGKSKKQHTGDMKGGVHRSVC